MGWTFPDPKLMGIGVYSLFDLRIVEFRQITDSLWKRGEKQAEHEHWDARGQRLL